jgi:hypothetical protein
LVVEKTLVIVLSVHGHGAGLVGPAAPQIDHHLAVYVEGERGAEVFPRLELGGEQLAQGVERALHVPPSGIG